MGKQYVSKKSAARANFERNDGENWLDINGNRNENSLPSQTVLSISTSFIGERALLLPCLSHLDIAFPACAYQPDSTRDSNSTDAKGKRERERELVKTWVKREGREKWILLLQRRRSKINIWTRVEGKRKNEGWRERIHCIFRTRAYRALSTISNRHEAERAEAKERS